MRITFDADLLRNPNVSSLKFDILKENDNSQNSPEFSLEKTEGSYFGEWALIGEPIGSLRAVAMGDVVCAVLTKENFDSVVGPLTKLSQDDHKYVASYYQIQISILNFFGKNLELFLTNKDISFPFKKCFMFLIQLTSFRSRDYSSDYPKESAKSIDVSAFAEVQLSDLVMGAASCL